MVRIQPLKLIRNARYEYNAKQAQRFFHIAEDVAPEVKAELEGAKSGIVKYAKANNVTISLSPNKEQNILDLFIENLDKKPMISKITKPIEYIASSGRTYINPVLRVSKGKGMNVVECVGKTEDTFLRHLYRNIEVLVKSMKK